MENSNKFKTRTLGKDERHYFGSTMTIMHDAACGLCCQVNSLAMIMPRFVIPAKATR